MTFKYEKSTIHITPMTPELNPNVETIPQEKQNTNTLYDLLQTKLNAPDRNLIDITNKEFEFHCQNTPTSQYNVSGNLSLSCYIPRFPEVAPNYVGLIMNDKSNDGENPKHPLMRILTDWIKSNDMLTYYYYSAEFSEENKVPPINMKNVIQKGYVDEAGNEYYFKWWNIGRERWSDKSDGDSTHPAKQSGYIARNLCQLFAKKLNDLFDYVISKDLITADNEFVEKLVSLFAIDNANLVELNDAIGGTITYNAVKLYPYSNGTLLLPSLVNYIAHNVNRHFHALSYCGYVPKDSSFYVSGDLNEQQFATDTTKYRSDTWEALDKQNGLNGGKAYDIFPTSTGMFNINEGLSNIGTYNYPFRGYEAKSNEFLKPHVMDAEKDLTDEIDRVNKNPPLTDESFKVGGKYKFPDDSIIIDHRDLTSSNVNNGKRSEKYEFIESNENLNKLGELIAAKETVIDGRTIPRENDVEETKMVRETRTVKNVKIPIGWYISYFGVLNSYYTSCWAQPSCCSDDKNGCRGRNWNDRDWHKPVKDWWSWGWNYPQLSGNQTAQAYKINEDITDSALDATDKNKLNVDFLNVMKFYIYQAELHAGNTQWFNLTNSGNLPALEDITNWDFHGLSPKDIKNYHNIGRFLLDLNNQRPKYYIPGRWNWQADSCITPGSWRAWFNKPNCPAGIGTEDAIFGYKIFGQNYDVLTFDSYSGTYTPSASTNVGGHPDFKTMMAKPTYDFRYPTTDDANYYVTIESLTYTITYPKTIKWKKLVGQYKLNTEKQQFVYVPVECYTIGSEYAPNIRKLSVLTSESKMNKNLYAFTDNVFKFWVEVIKSYEGSQFVLNKLRDYIKEHYEIIMLNKTTQYLRSYADNLFRGEQRDMSFINIPFGPPLVHVPKTILFKEKFVHATFNVQTNEKYKKYNRNNPNLNVVNLISTEKDSNNYMDTVFKALIKPGDDFLKRPINDDVYFTILLPTKGQDILDMIGPALPNLISTTILKSHKWSDPVNSSSDDDSIYNTNIPKIVLTFRPLDQYNIGDHNTALTSYYKFIDSVNVPIICFHRENQSDSYVEVRIDTRTVAAGTVENKSPEPSDKPENLDKALDDVAKEMTGSGSKPGVIGFDEQQPQQPAKESYTRIVEHMEEPTQPVEEKPTTAEANVIKSGFEGKCQFPMKNVLYIYVSNSTMQDFTSLLKGKTDNLDPKTNISNPMLSINYRGLDAMYPSNCIRCRNFDALYSDNCAQYDTNTVSDEDKPDEDKSTD